MPKNKPAGQPDKVCGYQPISKESFIESVEGVTAWPVTVQITHPGTPIHCRKQYDSPDDLPEVEDHCNCGRFGYAHWFIRYTDG